MKNNKNLFVSFEGPEASGKSSQIKLLAKYLRKNRIAHIITREPGGTKMGEKLRKIILDKKENITPSEEILLLMSARLNHINNVILPSLKKGKIHFNPYFVSFGKKLNYFGHKYIDLNYEKTNSFNFKLGFPLKKDEISDLLSIK